jgi:hypothetical protein
MAQGEIHVHQRGGGGYAGSGLIAVARAESFHHHVPSTASQTDARDQPNPFISPSLYDSPLSEKKLPQAALSPPVLNPDLNRPYHSPLTC